MRNQFGFWLNRTRSRSSGRSMALVLFGLLAAFGYAHGQPLGAVTGGDDRLDVQVANGTANNLRVYVLVSGAEVLIGRVPPLSESTLRIPPGVTGTMRLVARPTAGADATRFHVSEPFILDRQHQIRWRLRASPGTADVPRASAIQIMARP
jgi:hypothetical protein